MYVRRDPTKRIARAPAKLNLYLEVMEPRGDGFHELETLMVQLRLSDNLSLERTPPTADGRPGEIGLKIRTCWPLRPPRQEPNIPAGRENLTVRALELLRERSQARYGARIELFKHVPAAAGLGGGSSDAAAALRLANRAWELNWPAARLAEVAAELGSDVPFFLSASAAICRGRGELVERLPPLPKLHFVIVKPPVDLRTDEVYRKHDELRSQSVSVPLSKLAGLTSARRPAASKLLHNRLQPAAAALSHWVEKLRYAFDRLDFMAHQLSGSGSAYFGVCRHAHHARRLATMLRTRQLGLVYATCSYP